MPLTMSMPVVQLLKKGSFHAHTKTEKIPIPKLPFSSSRDDHTWILKMFCGYVHSLKKVIRSYINKEVLSVIDESSSEAANVEPDSNTNSPRNSLKTWKQTAKQASIPRKAGEIEVAHKLRNFTVEYPLTRFIN